MSPTSLLIDRIGELTTNDETLAAGGRLRDAAVVVEHDRIVWVGPAERAPATDERFDAAGRALLPGWVDSHTHLVFAGDRTAEFEARMAGEAYAAGGINVTVEATRAATDAALDANLRRLVGEARRGGTTTIETKTGYGLTVADELRAARIAGAHADAVTFLGAHVVPAGSDPAAYLDLVTGEMLDAVAPHVSAVDVFCERGAFDAAGTARVLAAAQARGLATRVHGNQLGHGPGVQLAVAHGSLSVDHVGFLDDTDIAALADSWSPRRGGSAPRGTVATVLPACDLSTRMPLAPARALLDAGVEVAIASNGNPGTSYTSSMAFCVATAVLQMGLTVQEAVRAATLGGAIALAMDEDGWTDPRGLAQPAVGRIRVGARADLHLLDAPSITHLAYRPGMPLTAAVWRAGGRVA
ncbi:amidohydrolase family protein [Leucobacter rhizosphaerae]|uniref:Imidazolonepropionase n=1 Tax=Leucobacter rhizosphaerae TaxID=2932245 RepID=A0ABY4FYU7_9MICO|nr:amidohydrolase family protein [Leucobacter rhizosphaerae]UOQ61289.1 amidohydrolase family protein [Leucobacter rhizosphaerae]